MPSRQGRVKVTTDHKSEFLRPVGDFTVKGLSLENSYTLLHGFRPWFYTAVWGNRLVRSVTLPELSSIQA